MTTPSSSSRSEFEEDSPESLSLDGVMVRREIARRDGSVATSAWKLPFESALAVRAGEIGLRDAADRALYVTRPKLATPRLNTLAMVDLFAGAGGLSLGFTEASRALGHDVRIPLAVDIDETALQILAANHPSAGIHCGDIRTLLPGAPGDPLSPSERQLRKRLDGVDLLVGGPPCQGHSDFNNRTRNNDPKNLLYLSMVRAAEVLRPEALVIENVPGAWRDRSRVVQRAVDLLADIGYHVDYGVLDLHSLGVPQTRKRLVVVATKRSSVDLGAAAQNYRAPGRDARWAIEDLEQAAAGNAFDTPARSNAATRSRINFLFDRDLYELPNDQRPPCHSAKTHSYVSIYGRLRWDSPSQTITRGFYSMCMGRYVHPSQPRTITAHEAARLQGFPDWYSFSTCESRNALALVIGNAVPPRLGYVLGLELLR